MRTKLLHPLLLVFMLMGLICCSPASEDSQPGYRPVFEKTNCPFSPPPGWVDGRTVECGVLLVPENRSERDNRTIRLAVAIFHPQGGTSEPDPVIYLSGGPGASALELIYLTFERGYAPMLASNRDIIIFDQRGVGFSDPVLDCTNAQDLGLELLDNELDERQLTDEEIGVLFDDAYRTCARDLAEIADLSMYNSLASAADVNDLRIALGYEKINLWGASYGTRLALSVMRDYPESIRSAVLDSVYPPDVDMYLETPANLERSMTLLFDTCAADLACNAAYPDLRQVFFDMIGVLNEMPASLVVVNSLNGKSYKMLFTGDALFGLVFQLLYQTDILPYLPGLIYDASHGEFDVIGRIYGSLLGLGSISSQGMTFSVQCNEEIPFSSLDQFEDMLISYPDFAPYLRKSIVGEIGYHICTFWDSGQADDRENEPVISEIPSLVLHGEFDPITPPAWGKHAAETLSHSYYYLFPAVGHGAGVTECGWSMMINFILNPSQPPDDVCLSEMDDLTFIIPEQ